MKAIQEKHGKQHKKRDDRLRFVDHRTKQTVRETGGYYTDLKKR